MTVESGTIIETLPGSESKVQELSKAQRPAEQVNMELAVALGVQAVKKQAKLRVARVKEVRARFNAGTYRQDSMAIAQKMLEIE